MAVTNYMAKRDFEIRHAKATTRAQKRIELKKDEIIAEINKEYPLSLNLLYRKYEVSRSTFIVAIGRWGFDYKKMASEINKRRIDEYNASAGKDVEKIKSNTNRIVERLSKDYPDRFIDICADIGSQPNTVKSVLLEDGVDISSLVKEGKRKRMAHFYDKKIDIDAVVDRLNADLPDTFVSICKEIGSTTTTIKAMAAEKGYDIDKIVQQARARRVGINSGKTFVVEKTLLNMAWV